MLKTNKKKALVMVRRQLVIPKKLDDKLRDLAHKNREWPSTTGGRLLAQALGVNGYDATEKEAS